MRYDLTYRKLIQCPSLASEKALSELHPSKSLLTSDDYSKFLGTLNCRDRKPISVKKLMSSNLHMRPDELFAPACSQNLAMLIQIRSINSPCFLYDNCCRCNVFVLGQM